MEATVAHGESVRIVRVFGFAHEIERIARSETRDEILTTLETHADDLREKILGFADRRETIARRVRGFVREKRFEESRIVAEFGGRSLGDGWRRLRLRRRIRSRSLVVRVVEMREKPLEGGFGGGRQRKPAGLTRA
jgi:hypothetical protein